MSLHLIGCISASGSIAQAWLAAYAPLATVACKPGKMSSPSDPSTSSVMDLSHSSAMAVPGGVGSLESSGSGTPSSMSETQLDMIRERSPPLTRRQTARPRRTVPKASASASESAPQVSATHTQKVLNVGVSPQEVIEAQGIAANQAAQAVAERAQVPHNEAIVHLEGRAHDMVQATFQEASVTVEKLRHELQVSEAKRLELIDLGRALEQQLKDCRAELTKAEAELNAVRFQLSRSNIEAQVKDREIHRLRQAAPSATDASGSQKPPENNVASASGQTPE